MIFISCIEDLLSAEHVESFLYHQVDTHGRLGHQQITGCLDVYVGLCLFGAEQCHVLTFGRFVPFVSTLE
jgi:hypothetical protein